MLMRNNRSLLAGLLTGAMLAGFGAIAVAELPASAATDSPADEQYRPYLHFTPEQNWMNDPNGLVYHKGVYHLFFQHNPSGTGWGNMSWGHATSTDLLHWTEQPVAIPQTFNTDGVSVEDIFSGSIVVDTDNSSGFGTAANPPLVAIYTSAYTEAHPTLVGKQAQSLAYSIDDGATWTKYKGNPVLDRDSNNFRDPKVFRYSGPAGDYWVMAAVEATEYKVVLYKSDDLKTWEHLSDFGPANAVGGIWECPELFPIAVDGDPNNIKWVMVVSINPGSVSGGSGGQYFVGDFDGVTFTSESTVDSLPTPEGTLLNGFDDGTYGGWTVNNEPGNWANGPWGDAPATGSLPGQSPVTGFVGDGLVNGFLDGDWPMGSIESPEFTLGSDYINLLVGGGNHPHVPGGQLGHEPPAGELLFEGFEFADGTDLADAGWTLTGDFEPSRNPSTAGGEYFIGDKRVNTFEGGPHGDNNVGTLTSPEFVIDDSFVSFLIGGGQRTDGTLEAQLLIDGEPVRSATGRQSGALNWQDWDVSDLAGQTASIRIVDQATGGWGHLTFDHVVMGPEPAQVRSDETAVNLVVGGEVVRTATGANSETLDWASWDVREFAGEPATIRIVDNNRSGWGHILADQFMESDGPAPTRLESYDWLDWGRDYYAAVSFSNVPDDKRLMIGWMSNWDYAGDIPTGSWRSAMTLPREVTLTQTPKGPRLVQKVVDQIDSLRQEFAAFEDGPRDIAEGIEVLPVDGDVVQIDATFSAGTAESFGLNVLSDGTHKTSIGYVVESSRLFVDRTNSGNVGFNPRFPSTSEAPVTVDADGKVVIRVYVDRASVEVFAADGLVTITDQVFPNAGADLLEVWSQGGVARLEGLKVTPLYGAMWDEQPVLTVPSTPLEVTAIASSNGSATVSWTAPTNDGGSAVTGYSVFESEDLETPVCSTVDTSCLVGGLHPVSTYSFVVVATNIVGDSEASTASAPLCGASHSSAKGHKCA
jgi:levanase